MVQEKRLNHEDHMSRQYAKSGRQPEDASADEVRYEHAPTVSMRSGSAFSSVQRPVFRSDVCAL
jgi:hypothetical protein